MLGNRTDVEEVRAQLARQPELFEQALAVAINHCLAGKAMEGRASLRVLVNATIGFEALAALVGKPAKSLHRMLGPR
ncbi:MAG: transcriptional regulator, partial [Proteobacteria bacterium]|nr:transcriptional regulator [Pseudomonadota bacterium]